MIELQVKERRRRTLSFRRTGVSAECQVADENYVPRVVLKPDAAKKRIEAALEKNALFKGPDKEQINTVIDAVEEEKHKAGDVIIKQGESGLYFYLLEAGACEVWLSMHNARNPQMVKIYGPGDSFGELALLYDAPRAATIKASTDCILWTMDRSTFRTILMASTKKKRNLYEDYLQNVPLLKGTAEARTRGAVVMKYGKGDYFGELALLNDEPRSATVLAVTDCKVVSINSESFKSLLGKLEDILQRKKTEYAAATASTS
ncbi:hypothetical protein BDL97_13G094900 [Sphagnum fallax]|nr:hypothetical protein BDL97_13G094900 [Sphagnum fallax]